MEMTDNGSSRRIPQRFCVRVVDFRRGILYNEERKAEGAEPVLCRITGLFPICRRDAVYMGRNRTPCLHFEERKKQQQGGTRWIIGRRT